MTTKRTLFYLTVVILNSAFFAAKALADKNKINFAATYHCSAGKYDGASFVGDGGVGFYPFTGYFGTGRDALLAGFDFLSPVQEDGKKLRLSVNLVGLPLGKGRREEYNLCYSESFLSPEDQSGFLSITKAGTEAQNKVKCPTFLTQGMSYQIHSGVSYPGDSAAFLMCQIDFRAPWNKAELQQGARLRQVFDFQHVAAQVIGDDMRHAYKVGNIAAASGVTPQARRYMAAEVHNVREHIEQTLETYKKFVAVSEQVKIGPLTFSVTPYLNAPGFDALQKLTDALEGAYDSSALQSEAIRAANEEIQDKVDRLLGIEEGLAKNLARLSGIAY